MRSTFGLTREEQIAWFSVTGIKSESYGKWPKGWPSIDPVRQRRLERWALTVFREEGGLECCQ